MALEATTECLTKGWDKLRFAGYHRPDIAQRLVGRYRFARCLHVWFRSPERAAREGYLREGFFTATTDEKHRTLLDDVHDKQESEVQLIGEDALPFLDLQRAELYDDLVCNSEYWSGICYF